MEEQEFIPFFREGETIFKIGRIMKEPEYEFFEKIGVVDTANDIMYTASVFKELMKWKIEYNKDYLKRIQKRRTALLNTKPYFINEITDLFLKGCEEQAQEDIRQSKNHLSRYTGKFKEREKDDLVRLKQIPITDFVSIGGGNKGKCIWHDDKNPSMQYYPKTNTVYCWSCGVAGDVISVVMQKFGVDFKEALKILKGE